MRLLTLFQKSSIATLMLGVAATGVIAQQPTAPSTWTSVEDAIGRKGAIQPGDVIKFAFPRSDLTVTVNGVQLKPALALGSWSR